MKRLSAVACVAFAWAFSSHGAAALTAKDLVGAWTLVSADAFGPSPKGMLIFDAKGHMVWMLMKGDLPHYASNNRGQGTAEENKATVQGMIAQYGSYRVTGTDLLVHIDGSSYPNWDGIDQKRTNVSVSKNELRWTQPTPSAGGPAAVVVWRRAR
jgi:hypothetical protein